MQDQLYYTGVSADDPRALANNTQYIPNVSNIPSLISNNPASTGILVDYCTTGLVRLNVVDQFVEFAQTKEFIFQTERDVSIDELHIKTLIIKQCKQIYNPYNKITAQKSLELSANGVIYLGKVFARNVHLFSLKLISTATIKANNCYLKSLSKIIVNKIVINQLLEANAPFIKLTTAKILGELKLYSTKSCKLLICLQI